MRRLGEGTLPARALAITFDDGYADNHDVALPILRRHGLNATFFVATGFLDGGIMWNDVLDRIGPPNPARCDRRRGRRPRPGRSATPRRVARRSTR
ncbi:MAG: polysaccharide deacetylase family protein [Comamonadaceae bacterium]|nr:polysaccharide deacetylase family protein [Comamonadaceae bacterium]